MKYSHGTFLHSKSRFKFFVSTPHQQTFASSNQRTFSISDEITYSSNLFTRNHRNDNNLFVISLLETFNFILYFATVGDSLIKSEALKTAGPEIHQ